ncbi:hypothetical protein DPEC_G00277080 [Dallia pectoralis]|uniref:Uncharacterized protein n=1 Tax=Dallia pectoralis TaxID=75939 RepID=A0ACC2FLW4_DALPE|nr:hypothetical protein DPEC_G00277080 [Dallia pectoralis]
MFIGTSKTRRKTLVERLTDSPQQVFVRTIYIFSFFGKYLIFCKPIFKFKKDRCPCISWSRKPWLIARRIEETFTSCVLTPRLIVSE